VLLDDLDREYTLEEIAIITRAGPARLLGLRDKGHLGVGADADIVVLDPDEVTDRASYAAPVTPSSGVRHLLVNGQLLIRDGQLRTSSLPGRPVIRDGSA
jgi:formylmethanofuran dehydrogenase subunit A